jgi:hypothetical protein
MHKFNWRTMIIFVMILLFGVILLGVCTAYVSKLKQQRRQLSDNGCFNCRTPAAIIYTRVCKHKIPLGGADWWIA